MTTTLPPTDRHTVYMPVIATGPVTADHPYETALLRLIINHPNQQHPRLERHPILMKVAQARVASMITRQWFGHVDPDGYGANHWVKRAGFPLPLYYGRGNGANNIEVLAGGFATPEEAFMGWLGSPGHRALVLGENDFYMRQSWLGVGYAYGQGPGKWGHYWACLCCEAEMESGE